MEQPEALKWIIESIDYAVVLINRALQVVTINEAAMELFGKKNLEEDKYQFGRLTGCEIKPTEDFCLQNFLCKSCEIAKAVKEALDTDRVINRRSILLPFTQKEVVQGYWQITFSAKKAGINSDDLVVLTFHSAEKKPIESSIRSTIDAFQETTLFQKQDKESKTQEDNQTTTCLLAVENAPFELIFTKPSGEIIFANKVAKQTLQQTSPQKDRYTIYDLNPMLPENWWSSHYEELEKKGAMRFETSHWNTKGFEIPVRVNMFLIEENGIKTVCYFSYDNTDQYKIQETLLKELRKNESLAEIANELSFHHSLSSIVLLVRQYALEITESAYCFLVYEDPTNNQIVASIYSDNSELYKEQVFLIESALKRHYRRTTQNQEDLHQAYNQALNDVNLFVSEEISFLDTLPFKRVAWTGVFSHEGYKGLLFVAGKTTDYLSVDLAHLKSLGNLLSVAINRIQEKIRLLSKMEQLELALDVAGMGVWNIFPMENKLVFDHLSDKLLYRIGFPNEINLDQPLKNIPPEDIEKGLIAFNEHLNSNSSYFRSTVRIKNTRNEYWWYEVSGRIINRTRTGEIERVTGVIMDINNTMALTQELTRSKEEADRANKAKGAFIARISHELRTPLNAIVGFTDILLNQISNSDQSNYLQNIKTSGVKLINLITEVLDLAKIESQKLVLKPELIELRKTVTEVYTMMDLMAKQKKLALKITIAGHIPDYLTLDEIQFRQILINLLSNAIKFTENGFVELKIEGSYATDQEFDLVLLVTDTGIGIKPESQIIIFEDFTQQEDQDNRRYGGTGLGLGIVKRLVELMEGTIKLESTPGQGSRFEVSLPKRKTGQPRSKRVQSEVITLQDSEDKKGNQKPDEIKAESREALRNMLKKEWDQFVSKPSFKHLPTIGEKINNIAQKNKDQALINYSVKLKNCQNTFDVEALHQIINEINELVK